MSHYLFSNRDPEDPAIPTRAEAERDAYYSSIALAPCSTVHDERCDDPWCPTHGTYDYSQPDEPPF